MRPQQPDRRRGWQFAALAALCVAVALGYVLWSVQRRAVRAEARPAAANQGAAMALLRAADDARPVLLARSLDDGAPYGTVAAAPLGTPDEARAATALRCDRVAIAAGRGLCLGSRRNALGNPYAVSTFGPDLQARELPDLRGIGIPSRARVSPDGRYGAFTVFAVGHSYAVGTFSTRTVILEMESGRQVAELEEFAVWRDGARFQSPDFNFWGVTFAGDSNRFYVTLGTGGATYLLEGDLAARRARVLRQNVECPSLSPDGTRIAFKSLVRGGDRPQWRLAVLDLATMVETPLAETANVDDQALWLDDRTVAYARVDDPETPGSPTDLWAVPADGGGTPRLLLRRAASPAVAR